MASEDFALVEEGTSRVFLFVGPGRGVIRALDGTWLETERSEADIVMPDELDDFRRASKRESLLLLREAAVSLPDGSTLAKILRAGLMFDWGKVTDFCWWDEMPAVLVRNEANTRAFSISAPDREWRPVNAAEVHDESRRVSKDSFQSLLDEFMAGEPLETNQPEPEKQQPAENPNSPKGRFRPRRDQIRDPTREEFKALLMQMQGKETLEAEESGGGPVLMPSND